MKLSNIKMDIEKSVAYVTINRPEKLNALDAETSPFTTIPATDESIERKPGESDPTGG